MSWPLLAVGAVLVAAIVALLHWQLNLAEGVYLGRRIVVLLYDRFAPRYDGIKRFNQRDEAWFLGRPLADALRFVTTSLVLDVATGTARLPSALFQQPTFTGRVVALDLSRQMLHQAAIKTTEYRDRLTLVWQDGTRLPFPDASFDAVTCLEALEFLPDARLTVVEMVRVLRPGGVFLATNRIGPGIRWMPGRTMTRDVFTGLLESMSLTDIRVILWQIDYDLAWARKPWPDPTLNPTEPDAVASTTLPLLLRCPRCLDVPLTHQVHAFCCPACDNRFPVADDGVVEMGF